MLTVQKRLDALPRTLVVSFDLEWTKNYRIPNGSQPFCFSFVFLHETRMHSQSDRLLQFGLAARYVHHRYEIPRLIAEADALLRPIMARKSPTLIVGHQLSSDLAVLLNHASTVPRNNIARLRDAWRQRQRHSMAVPVGVFDTRYDVGDFINTTSRRLVDVCLDCNLDVRQPEVQSSMTAMQNTLFETHNTDTLERLMVLNIRHSLSAALVYRCYRARRRYQPPLNVNYLIHNNLCHQVDYIGGDQFAALL